MNALQRLEARKAQQTKEAKLLCSLCGLKTHPLDSFDPCTVSDDGCHVLPIRPSYNG